MRFRSGQELLEAYSREFPTGGLFAPTTSPLQAGDQLVVEVSCHGIPNKVLLRGTVHSWRPALPRMRIRAGAVVVFAPEEKDKRDFLLGMLAGSIKDAPRRRYTRIPVSQSVRYRIIDTSELVEATLCEVSMGGGLLRSAAPPPVGTELVLFLVPPGGAAAIEIEGTVSYLTADGGIGVRFSFRDGGGARRLRELIRRIRALG